MLTAENAAAARSARSSEELDLVLLDIWMPDTDGVTLLKEWASTGQLTMPVIMMSGHATIDTAVEATRFGALEFLEKPIAMTRLLTAVRSGLERGRVMRNLRMTVPAALGAVALAPTAAAGDAVRQRPNMQRSLFRRSTTVLRSTSRCAMRVISSSACTLNITLRARVTA